MSIIDGPVPDPTPVVDAPVVADPQTPDVPLPAPPLPVPPEPPTPDTPDTPAPETPTPAVPDTPKPQQGHGGYSDVEWTITRTTSRYIAGADTTGATLICIDCGCVVHVSLTWKHDQYHDGSK